MIMNKALIFFSLLLLLKVANSEWVLGVHLQHFQNLYNAEIRNGVYCCCDIPNSIVPCVSVPTDLNPAACTADCEPYFEIRFEVCFADGTCSNMKNETTATDNILASCISPLLVQLHSNESMNDNTMMNGNITMNDDIVKITLYVDVLESSLGEPGGVFFIDNFTIAIPGTVSNCADESNSVTVQGLHGVGNLKLAYFNLTTDPITSCSSADVSTFSTSSPTTTTVTISSCPASMVTNNLCPEATQVVEEATGESETVWRLTALASLAVVLLLAIACAALGIITCRRKKGLQSQETDLITKDKELEPIMSANDDDSKNPFYDPVTVTTDESKTAPEKDFSQHVYSTVDKDKKSSNRPSGESDAIEENS